ncbi:MAG: HAD-IC family P-type ATPase [Actinobacteria bacterium]|nr:HAD-IC family P-type ATPase [Actinomycetota bacterium]
MSKSQSPTSKSGIEPKGTASGEQQWHVLTAEEVVGLTETDPDGLSEAEAAKRLATYGPNVISRGKGDTVLDLIWRQINNPLIWVLIVSAFVAMIADPTGGIKNGLVILAVVVINTIIGFIQEYKAGKAIEALSRMVPENVSLMRGGKKVTLPATDLVPGDVVLLASGDRVPADMRLIQSRTLQIEEAALTGESVPSAKELPPVAPESGIGDRTCMTFAGTLVTYGTGTAVVVETADNTELGRISTMLKETTDLETPLTRDLHKIGMIITVAIVSISVVMLAVGTWRTVNETGAELFMAFRETVIFAIALAVGAIPEGLPAIVTIALAIGVQRMAARNAVVRKLPAVETLGSTTVICSDKTGTLTRNEMTVQELWTPASGAVSVTGVGYEPTGHMVRNGDKFADLSSDFRELLMVGAVCNDASLENAEGAWKINGDPTEGALLVSAEKAGMSADALRKEYDRLDAIPFESENQFMATLNARDGGVLLIKGAPEAILSRCNTAMEVDLDHDTVLREVEALAARGMRVLAFASKAVPGMTAVEMSDTDGDFTFLGLQGMIDPPRPEAMAAIKLCHQAGIEVKMITGDHKGTAQAIAEQIDILPKNPDAPRVYTGVQLAEMSEAELVEAASSCNVFARVAPEHKLRLVNALQSRSHIVAMTGDGVNDAPALKQSNIGVAMGITGTAVSKEASEIVLVDDNFASIAAAVEEGRRVYDNLIKSLAFVLPTNLGLALILIWAVIFFPFGDVTKIVDGVSVTVSELLLPMGPTQLLWINLIAAVALALPLAFEAKEPGIMNRKPRDPDAPVLSGFVIMRVVIVAVLMTAGAVALFSYVYAAGGSQPGALATAQTAAVTTVIMFQIFYLLNCRSLKNSILEIGVLSNKTVFIGIASILVLQAIFIYAPFMNSIFGSAPLEPGQILMAAAAGTIILPVISFEKWLRKRKGA